MNFEYTKEKISGALVFRLKGELIDKNQSADFLNDVDSMIATGESKFVLDLAGLAYMNSSGLNVIINVLTKSRKAGGDVAVANVAPKVKQLLVITKLSSIFNLSDTLEGAIKLLA